MVSQKRRVINKPLTAGERRKIRTRTKAIMGRLDKETNDAVAKLEAQMELISNLEITSHLSKRPLRNLSNAMRMEKGIDERTERMQNRQIRSDPVFRRLFQEVIKPTNTKEMVEAYRRLYERKMTRKEYLEWARRLLSEAHYARVVNEINQQKPAPQKKRKEVVDLRRAIKARYRRR